MEPRDTGPRPLKCATRNVFFCHPLRWIKIHDSFWLLYFFKVATRHWNANRHRHSINGLLFSVLTHSQRAHKIVNSIKWQIILIVYDEMALRDVFVGLHAISATTCRYVHVGLLLITMVHTQSERKIVHNDWIILTIFRISRYKLHIITSVQINLNDSSVLPSVPKNSHVQLQYLNISFKMTFFGELFLF